MGFETTTSEVIDGIALDGTVAVVTGATTGLGWETARCLAATGAHVVICGRTAEKCRLAIDEIVAARPDASLDFEPFDLGDLATVRVGADAIVARHPEISILVNNAGVMFTPEGRTVDGFETQFGTNHLGHFVLTNHLMPSLLAGAPSRIVNLSSAGHGFSDIHWDDPNFASRPYDKFEAYGQSKTANILFTLGLEARYAPAGVRSNAVHPGMIMTDLARHMDAGDMEDLGARASQREASGRGKGLGEFKTVEQGAATSVFAAVSPKLEGIGGRYLEDTDFGEAAAWATDPDSAERLWVLSESLVGESYPA